MASEKYNPGTLADISKHLRDWADRLPEDEDGGWFERTIEQMQEILRDLADRIDAAWKRERDAITAEKEHFRLYGLAEHNKVLALKSSPVGSAAALREALDGMLILACGICENTLCANKNGCEDGTPERCDPVNKANAALSAPARNCDRFGGDIDKLREACARERGLNPEEDFPDVFPEWLLAPSEEQKGEGDGK